MIDLAFAVKRNRWRPLDDYNGTTMPLSGDIPVICQLVHGLPVGGAEVLVDRMIRALNDRYRFVVACLDCIGELGERLREDGVEVVVLGRNSGFDWGCARRLRQFVQSRGIKLLHAHQCTPFAYVLASGILRPRPPVLLTEHGRFFPDHPNRKRKFLHRLLIRKRDQFVAVGKAVRQALIDNEGLPQHRIQVVYNGVQTSRFEPNPSARSAVRRELGVADHELVVMNVARLDPIKDQVTAVRAFALAVRSSPGLRLFIIGEGPAAADIERSIHELHVAGRVNMLGVRDDVCRLLSAADIFLLTSVSEGIPVTVLEAMATGVPVVATEVGGLPELITHNETGLLAPPGDSTQLAAALTRLAGDPKFGAALAYRATERIHGEFSEAVMVAHYDAIYRDMLNLRASPASVPRECIDEVRELPSGAPIVSSPAVNA